MSRFMTGLDIKHCFWAHSVSRNNYWWGQGANPNWACIFKNRMYDWTV